MTSEERSAFTHCPRCGSEPTAAARYCGSCAFDFTALDPLAESAPAAALPAARRRVPLQSWSLAERLSLGAILVVLVVGGGVLALKPFTGGTVIASPVGSSATDTRPDQVLCRVVRDVNTMQNSHVSVIAALFLDRAGSLSFSPDDLAFMLQHGQAAATVVVEDGGMIVDLRYPQSPQLIVDLKDSVGAYGSGLTSMKVLLDQSDTRWVDYEPSLSSLSDARRALGSVNDDMALLEASGVLVCPGGYLSSATGEPVPAPTSAPTAASSVSAAPFGTAGSETVTVGGGLYVRVIAAETWTGYESYLPPNAGDVYLTLSLSVRAVSDSPIIYLGASVADSSGSTHDVLLLPRREPVLPNSIVAGQTTIGYLTFEVPSDAHGFTLLFPGDTTQATAIPVGR